MSKAPRPWRINKDQTKIIDADRDTVIYIVGAWKEDLDDIVKCVNAHDDLLDACEVALRSVSECNCTCAYESDAILEAAIAKARGES